MDANNCRESRLFVLLCVCEILETDQQVRQRGFHRERNGLLRFTQGTF